MTDHTSDPPGLAEATRPHYHGHRERLRERFLEAPEALPDYEILELLLAIAIPRQDLKPRAKELIERFGSLADLLSADYTSLAKTKGQGPSSTTMLKIVREAAVRLARAPILGRPVIATWEQLLDYCSAAMATLPIEQFRLLFLDRKNLLITDELQQEGTVDHTPLYPREVVKRALELNASAVIMVHNHPSGDPTPSRADIEMTRTVRDALKGVGILLHDHLVIGRGKHVSFKSMALL